ncbi:MAG: DNA mismatch repair endonuclease MutL [Ignavibacterium sp.]|nr:DNA mismatch repair endonuclease MutL [Ignavibacterium sp.]
MSVNRIKILPENLANKIAAGEVVQRPESVVKELLENAIDANAKNIEVIIKQSGKSLIQVCDDGLGMTEDDVKLCIQKHATSKIYDYKDLEAIKTLGFRGEALSSIGSVSQFEIKTETRDEEIGTLLKIENDNQITIEKTSAAKGTCVSVKNLFYNTPARRKFLKTDGTELKHIIDTFNKLALSNPEISFKFYNNDNLVFEYAACSTEDRLKQVFADNILDGVVPVYEKTEYITIKGFIGKPTLLTKSKGDQYLFLNKRFVISKQINHAVFNAYENILEKGDYPFFVLFLSIDPSRVDVNIHPSKLEVKFDDDRDVYHFVMAVIKKSLGMYDLVPSMTFDEKENDEKLRFEPFNKTAAGDFSDRPSFIERKERIPVTNKEIDLVFGSLTTDIKRKESTLNAHSFLDEDEKDIFADNKTVESQVKSPEETTFITQLHNKYIISQIKSGLMIIDQHVAHERILYEKILNRLEANMPFSQHLLFPLTIQFDPGSFEILQALNPLLNQIGFQLKFFSKNTIVIEGVPEDIKSGSEERILREFIKEYSVNDREKKLEQKDNIAKSYSCKAAIKAGDKLSEKEMHLLIDQLFATSMPYVCPHGRPIIIKISLEEFDRRFGRT